MRIGINTVDMLPGFGGGEEIFIRRVLASISEQQGSAEIVVLTDVLNHGSFDGFECVQVRSAKEIGRAVESENIDMVFSPYRNTPTKLSVPLVLLVMELYDVEQKSSRKRLWGGGSNLRSVGDICNQAAALVVPSEFMKKELLRLFTVPLNKVVVAPMGVDPCFGTEQRCIVQQPYYLTVGRVCPRKNLDVMLEAFSKIEDEIEHSLVIVGQPGEGEPEHWGDRVIRIDRLGTTQLAGLYKHCDMYLCPSLYEGSGITVLEAFQSGALVGTGRIGGIAEVASDAPMYFKPDSAESIVGILRRAAELTDEERERRVEAGRQLTVEYTWEQCSQRTLSAFRKALGNV
jgi:glycosyltransferase involved in cell wall biosynthesis